MREIWTTVLHTSAARVYSLAAGMLVLFATARLLGPEGRGQVAAVTAWVTLFATCAYLSLDQVALHRLAQDPQHDRLPALFGSLLTMAAVVTGAGWACAVALYAWQPETFKGLPPVVLLAGFVALPFLVWEHYGSYLLTGLGSMRIYNTWQVLGRTLSLAAVLLMVMGLGWGVTGAVLGTTVGSAVVALGGIRFLAGRAAARGRIAASRPELRALLAGGAKLHLNAIGTVLVGYGNILVLNHYRSAEEVGWFQLASQLVGVLMILPQAATMVIFGEVARVGPDQAWPRNRRLLGQVAAAIAVLGAAAAALAPWVVPLLAGAAFVPAVQPFQWMLLGLAGTTLSALMAPQWIGRGYFWQASGITLALGCANLLANLWVIPEHGIPGAVAVFLGTSLLQVLVNAGLACHCELQQRKEALVQAG